MAQREKLRGSIADLGLEISAAKDDLADAYRELKSYEIAQAARDAREKHKQELREREKMDEIGMGYAPAQIRRGVNGVPGTYFVMISGPISMVGSQVEIIGT